jgi:pyruvate dehydrogenase E1 component alpha subunit
MNLAALQRVPVIFVFEQNGYAYSTPSERQFVVSPLERAAGYGIDAVAVDGNDVEAVFEVTREARERALAGEGPTLIAAQTMRMHGHGAHDDASYVPTELIEHWAARDPLERQRERLRALGVDVEAIDAGVREEVDRASTEAVAMAEPLSGEPLADVFCAGEPQPLGRGEAPWSGFREAACS